MNQDQKNYLIRQIREHMQWQLNNAKLLVPMQFTETEIAHALNDRGFIIEQRPITDVSLPPTEEMVANKARYDAYLLTVNALLGTYIDGIVDGTKDSPAQTLNQFIVELSAIQV